jgi:hypothetical protein
VKGLASLAGALSVRLGTAGLKLVLAKAGDWASRNGRSVELSIDGDTIKITGATPQQQEQLIGVWLAGMRPAPELPGPRLALVVATTTYADAGFSRLRAPAQDAVAMIEVLSDPAVGGFAVTSALDRPEHEIRQAIGTFLSGRGVDDLVVVYLSCHGVLDARPVALRRDRHRQGRAEQRFRNAACGSSKVTGVGSPANPSTRWRSARTGSYSPAPASADKTIRLWGQ